MAEKQGQIDLGQGFVILVFAVDTSAGDKLAGSGDRDEKLDFLLLLYKIFAEYMSLRLRLTNEELIKAKQEVEKIRESKMNIIMRKIQGKDD